MSSADEDDSRQELHDDSGDCDDEDEDEGQRKSCRVINPFFGLGHKKAKIMYRQSLIPTQSPSTFTLHSEDEEMASIQTLNGSQSPGSLKIINLNIDSTSIHSSYAPSLFLVERDSLASRAEEIIDERDLNFANRRIESQSHHFSPLADSGSDDDSDEFVPQERNRNRSEGNDANEEITEERRDSRTIRVPPKKVDGEYFYRKPYTPVENKAMLDALIERDMIEESGKLSTWTIIAESKLPHLKGRSEKSLRNHFLNVLVRTYADYIKDPAKLARFEELCEHIEFS